MGNVGLITIDGVNGKIYFTDATAIKRANLDGSGVEVIVPDALAGGLALDTVNETIYWTRDEDGGFDPDIYQVQRANLDGSNVEVLLDRDAGLERPVDLAVDPANSTLYIADRPSNSESRIQQAALDGSGFGALIDLSTVSVTEPQGLTVANGALYFTARTQGTIYRSGLDGSALTPLYTSGGDFVEDISVTANHIYFTLPGSFDETVRRVDLNGQNEERLDDTSTATSIAADASNGRLYWSDIDTDALKQSSLTGSNVRVLLSGPGGSALTTASDIAYDPETSFIYWTNDNSDVRGVASSIGRANVNGSGAETLLDGQVTRPFGIAVDADARKLYWMERSSSDQDTDGRLRRANLDGTQVETIVDNIPAGGRLFLDAPNGVVYWTEREEDPSFFATFVNFYQADLDGSNVTALAQQLDESVAGFVVDTPNERIYYLNTFTGSVDVVSFDRSVMETVFSGEVEPGKFMNSLRELAIDPANQRLYWTQVNENEVANSFEGIASVAIDGTDPRLVLDLDAGTTVDLDRNPGALTLIPPLASASQTISSSTGSSPLTFGATGVSIAFNGVSGSGDVTVSRFNDPPLGASLSEPFVSQYRIVITAASGLTVGSGTKVRFDTGSFPGIGDPSTVQVYSRSGPNDAFTAVSTSPDGTDLVATVDGFSEFVLASNDPANPLPVELTAFTATADGADAVLTWQTASETNNAGFHVEQRQPDGTSRQDVSTWKSLGFVEGAGTTTEPQDYRFRVRSAGYGEQAFRLRQVDTDGTESLSDVQTVRITPTEAVAVSAYPNPFGNGQPARITVTPREAQQVTVDVFDMLGRRVARLHDGRLNAGEATTLTLSGAQHASGVYFVRVVGEQFQTTTRLTLVR